MTITRNERSRILAFTVAMALLAGCQKSVVPPATTGSAPAQGSEAVAPAASLTLVNAVLASTLPASGEINPVTTFAPADSFNAVAVIEGDAAQAAVRAEILNSAGEVVAQGATDAPVATKAAVAVPMQAPQGGWSPGAYTARFYLDGVPSWEVEFTVVP